MWNITILKMMMKMMTIRLDTAACVVVTSRRNRVIIRANVAVAPWMNILAKLLTIDIEIAVAKYFGIRRHLIVPNVSWGLNLHECDMLIVTRMGYATEVEIKTNLADLKRDSKKWHGHNSKKIKRLFFAVPEELGKQADMACPERAGIIVVHCQDNCSLYRSALNNANADSLTQKEIIHLGRLASMRIWSLKQRIKERMP